MDLTNEQMENLKSFLLETFAFTDEQTAAMDADKTFYRLLKEYPDFTDIYGQKLEKEVNERCPDTELPDETPEERQASWERLCAKIRAEFGEDAI